MSTIKQVQLTFITAPSKPFHGKMLFNFDIEIFHIPTICFMVRHSLELYHLSPFCSDFLTLKLGECDCHSKVQLFLFHPPLELLNLTVMLSAYRNNEKIMAH